LTRDTKSYNLTFPPLTYQLDEIAIQIEESHEKFVVLAESLKARQLADFKRPEVK
jgi:hypothetical protein